MEILILLEGYKLWAFKKSEIYYIDYKLIKEVNGNVYNNFVNKKEEDSKSDDIISSNISLTNINVDNYLEEKNSGV